MKIKRATTKDSLHRVLVWGILPLLLATGSAVAQQQKFFPAQERAISDQYIVVLAEGVARKTDDTKSTAATVDQVAAELADLYGGKVERTWEHGWQGFQIRLGELQAQRLSYDPLVAKVQQDQQVLALGNLPTECYDYNFKTQRSSLGTGSLTGSGQAIVCDDPDPRNPNRDCIDNWGLDRIDQVSSARDGSYTATGIGNGVHVYVLDTGINKDHEEFEEFGPPFTRVVGGFNAVLGGDPTNTDDCVGHGTHVAGIIGGGTSGVAKKVWLHPVKFLDTCGGPVGGDVSDVLEGLEWIRVNHATPAVVNWSGGNGSGNTPPYNDPIVVAKVRELLDAGISFVQAAGNQKDNLGGQDACGRSLGGAPNLDEVIVVGGTDANQSLNPIDGRWIRELGDPSYSLCTGVHKDCGSNSGSCVDIWAPAAHIISAQHDDDDGLCRLSGTSMAAPHVTGVAALYLKDNPTATPAQVQQAILGGGTCGALDNDPTSPYSIGADSPNLLLNSMLNGGGCAADLSVSLAETASQPLTAAAPINRAIIQPLPTYFTASVENLGPANGENVVLVVRFSRAGSLGRANTRDSLVPITIQIQPQGAALDCDLVIKAPEYEPYPQTYTCDLGAMATGTTTDLTWTVLRGEVPPGPDLHVQATVTSSGTDPVPANNQAQATIN